MSSILTAVEKPLSATGANRQVSWLGRVDPRVRILCAAAFAATVVACDRFGVLIAALSVALVLMAGSGLPPRRTLRRMAAMDGFILFMLVLLPFTVPGEPFLTVWGVSASWEGLEEAARIGLTANAVILALMALVGSMEPVTLGHALHTLRVPATLVHLLMFTVRYIDVLREEYLRLRQAMKARGFRPSTGWHTYRSFGYLVGMMLVRSLERSERILEAMKCRGFTGRLPLLEQWRVGITDLAFTAGFAVALAALIAGEVAYGAL
jgi:cobalt/nickel transport system permease protein